MAEYVYAEDQTVASGENVLFQESIPCNKGYVLHRPGSGMRHDLEMKMANARNEDERQMYMRMMEAM